MYWVTFPIVFIYWITGPIFFIYRVTCPVYFIKNIGLRHQFLSVLGNIPAHFLSLSGDVHSSPTLPLHHDCSFGADSHFLPFSFYFPSQLTNNDRKRPRQKPCWCCRRPEGGRRPHSSVYFHIKTLLSCVFVSPGDIYGLQLDAS